jgi:hypothetical protein
MSAVPKGPTDSKWLAGQRGGEPGDIDPLEGTQHATGNPLGMSVSEWEEAGAKWDAENARYQHARAAAAAAPQNPTPAPEQSLISTTVSGGPYSADWNIKWKLAKPSKQGGWIVQEISETDTSGNQVQHYWEAWRVLAKQRFPTTHGIYPQDDTFQGGPSGNKVSANARFYEGLRLPSSFVVHPNSAAGSLRSTTTNPHLPTKDATNVVWRIWAIP